MSKSTKGWLLYRATTDGFSGNDFHSRCDGKTSTITIIKNNLNYVFGGYASASWNNHTVKNKNQNGHIVCRYGHIFMVSSEPTLFMSKNET